MVVEVMHRLPLDGWFIALIHISRTTNRCSKGMQLTLDSMSFCVCVSTQLGFGEWC